jgi:hypothetical protein
VTNHADDNYLRRIIHVHGRYDDPRGIILTEEDYGAYVRSPVFQQFWNTIPVVTRLVFFGFSFDDLDLLYGFRHARMALGGNAQQLEARHFTVMALNDPAREPIVTVDLMMRYGIQPVFCPNSRGNFSEHSELLARLKSEVLGLTVQRLAEEPIAAVEQQVAEIVEHAVALPGEESLEAVQVGVAQLTLITRQNIAKKRTGDLE